MSDIDVGDILNESLASSMALHCDLPLSQETTSQQEDSGSVVRKSTCTSTSYEDSKTPYMCLALMWEAYFKYL
jgi:hypothetical protein